MSVSRGWGPTPSPDSSQCRPTPGPRAGGGRSRRRGPTWTGRRRRSRAQSGRGRVCAGDLRRLQREGWRVVSSVQDSAFEVRPNRCVGSPPAAGAGLGPGCSDGRSGPSLLGARTLPRMINLPQRQALYPCKTPRRPSGEPNLRTASGLWRNRIATRDPVE